MTNHAARSIYGTKRYAIQHANHMLQTASMNSRLITAERQQHPPHPPASAAVHLPPQHTSCVPPPVSKCESSTCTLQQLRSAAGK
mmetsp:Transcript_24141/g.52750  ORF Transcript_24141/g.52750 Transcript_24141/m.52750 type:complete len:85 (+) Transcript_24141:1160-1414(+)